MEHNTVDTYRIGEEEIKEAVRMYIEAKYRVEVQNAEVELLEETDHVGMDFSRNIYAKAVVTKDRCVS